MDRMVEKAEIFTGWMYGAAYIPVVREYMLLSYVYYKMHPRLLFHLTIFPPKSGSLKKPIESIKTIEVKHIYPCVSNEDNPHATTQPITPTLHTHT